MNTALPPSRSRMFHRFIVRTFAPVAAGITLATFAGDLFAAKPTKSATKADPTATVIAGKDGTLQYTNDISGDRIPDYSFAGYHAGEQPIPNATARVIVSPLAGDNTSRIQAAIDFVGSLSPDEHGLRGAVLLKPGTFEINGSLRIGVSGVVLRGSGMGIHGTHLLATGTDRRTLVTLVGTEPPELAAPTAVTDTYVPANASKLHLTSTAGLAVGTPVAIKRPCTDEWIATMRMRDLGGGMGSGWKAGLHELVWDRTITNIIGDEIAVDAPLTDALDTRYGGGTVSPYQWNGRITEVGVEGLCCDSAFDSSRPKDEAHSWIAVEMIGVRDAWVRQVAFQHFAGSAVTLLDSTSRVTVQDCSSVDPVSEIGGYRRLTFFTAGQQTLFQRCYSEQGRHDFAVGHCAAGPNAFVECEARDAIADSGPIDSWAAGILYDNVRIDGAALSLYDRRYRDNFVGWSAANSMIWQCNASVINCFDPPTAHNWCYASWGMFAGDSAFRASDNTLSPTSLYYGQLSDRLGTGAGSRAQLLPINSRSSRNPTLDDAAVATANSVQPPLQLRDWISAAPQRDPLPIEAGPDARAIDAILTTAPAPTPPIATHPITVRNGWLVNDDGSLVVGGRQSIKWWRGGIRPAEVTEAAKEGPNPTRFVPGRGGRGLTDDLSDIADQMQAHHRSSLDYHYALWYDLRDIDHERVRRVDGDVWPPFYEMPFARSGIGTAWDGLSKYDLQQYNPWYWSRLQRFAEICDQRGLVLLNNDFFQHNILEAGAHWASCPWRPANNVNDTGFPEPPPYAGDKLIYMAQQFYDVTNPVRAKIYRDYIRQCLAGLAGHSNVIQFTSAEFTGPPAFGQFWVDTVADWERETGKRPLIGLAAPKNVQDAVLDDPERAKTIDVIDIRYWWIQAGGKLYAPPGGQNLTPRQWMRGSNPKMPDFAAAAQSILELRLRFPDKAVLLSPEDGGINTPWGVVMGGGSMPDLIGAPPALLKAIPRMRPLPAHEGTYVLSDPGRSYLIYANNTRGLQIDLSNAPGVFARHDIDPKSNAITAGTDVAGGAMVPLHAPAEHPCLVWLSRK